MTDVTDALLSVHGSCNCDRNGTDGLERGVAAASE